MLNKLKKTKKNIYIYGANSFGKILLEFCENSNINIAGFCDGSPKVSKSKFCDKDVFFISELKEKNPIFIIAATSINDVILFLNSLNYKEWYSGTKLIDNIDNIYLSNNERYDIDVSIKCHENYNHPEKFFLRSVDLVITERCSLKCKDCSNLMQYYEKPINYSTDDLFKYIDKFCSLIDEVLEFRLIGGDVWMNKDWYIIVDKLLKEDKVKKIVLFTNGTIIPKNIEILKNKKIRIIVTDYGENLSKKIKPLVSLLKENNVLYKVSKTPGWFDCASISKHNRTKKELKKVYNECCAKNMITLMNGKIYNCPYGANAYNLKAVPKESNDYIDIINSPFKNKKLKKKLKSYILNIDYLKVCDFCKSRPVYAPEIEPAKQIKKSLEYKRYY